jgi:hypothetical protein
MTASQGILIRDLARMADEAPQQIGARVSHDAKVISDHEFHVKHGMSREAYIERESMRARDAFEQDAVQELDVALDHLSGSANEKWVAFCGLLKLEQGKLAGLEAKRAELEGMASSAVAVEAEIKKLIRRSADFLLGKSVEESDASQRLELERKRVEQAHRAEAARVALPDLEKQIDKQQLRCRRLRDRERDFLVPLVFSVVEQSGVVQRWRAARNEMIATETLLRGLLQSFVPPDGCSYPWQPPRESTPATHVAMKQWAALAEQLRRDPRAEVQVPQ